MQVSFSPLLLAMDVTSWFKLLLLQISHSGGLSPGLIAKTNPFSSVAFLNVPYYSSNNKMNYDTHTLQLYILEKLLDRLAKDTARFCPGVSYQELLDPGIKL